jgi:hypothetical protein
VAEFGSLARMRERKSIRLLFSDDEMAQALASSTPPDGVTKSEPAHIVQASATSGGIFTQIVIQFVPQFSATLLAGWILLALGKRGKKHTRINRKDVALKEADIVRLIQDELSKQEAREAQYRKDYDNAP